MCFTDPGPFSLRGVLLDQVVLKFGIAVDQKFLHFPISEAVCVYFHRFRY